MDRVLFACVHNAGRSQMAAAWMRLCADPKRVHVLSAGTNPGEHVHPVVVDAMAEVGADLKAIKPIRLTAKLAGDVTTLITMGCGEACPVMPGAEVEDWPLRDPKDLPLVFVRAIRDVIRDRVYDLATRKGWLAEEVESNS